MSIHKNIEFGLIYYLTRARESEEGYLSEMNNFLRKEGVREKSSCMRKQICFKIQKWSLEE